MSDCCGSRRCTCTLLAGPGVEIDGSGSTGNPYVISAPGGGTPTVLQAGDTETVDTTVTGTGTAADPVIISGTVRLDPTPPSGGTSLISSGPDGLFVTIETACGLAGDGSSGAPLAVAVGAWPFPCPIDTNGGGVYCDPDSGELRADPAYWADFQGNQENTTLGSPLVVPSAPSTVVDSISVDITNPDPCRPAIGLLFREIDLEFTLPPDSGGSAGIDGDDMVYHGNQGSGTIIDTHVQTNKLSVFTLNPGETRTITMDVTASRGTGGATIGRIQKTIRAWAWSNRFN
ncbi:hypothetical protein ACFYSF_22305 [Streptomyces canus]|uniref:hypothetical protein n=1 Tax=Streptomyces canus TaxID=58343 RepID=UPI0036B8978A